MMTSDSVYRGVRIKDNPDDYKMIRTAGKTFLSCILFETAGMMAVMFLGTLGAEMAIYFMTFLYSFFMSGKLREPVPIHRTEPKLLLHTLGIAVCGIPAAMLLNALGCLLSGSGADVAEDVSLYPAGTAVLAFALVPAIVEEFVFRGVIFGAYKNVDVRAAVLISSIFFALLHFSFGSVVYGFFFGCLFALVRLATDNLLYTVTMHCAFNAVNVVLSYADMEAVSVWILLLCAGTGLIGFIVLVTGFFRRFGTELKVLGFRSRYKPFELITREGYVAGGVCLLIMCILLL